MTNLSLNLYFFVLLFVGAETLLIQRTKWWIQSDCGLKLSAVSASDSAVGVTHLTSAPRSPSSLTAA